MGIDDEDPEIRRLRSELLKTLRDTAFEIYVKFGDGPGQRRNMEGHIFAGAIVAAITPRYSARLSRLRFEQAAASGLGANRTAPSINSTASRSYLGGDHA